MARFLVVEDEPASRELLRLLLVSAGHKVQWASDGMEGYLLALTSPPDIVLCDLQMPVVDGFELLHRLRADPFLRERIVIAVTALSMPGDIERLLNAGFDGYVTKPISPETFVAYVEELAIEARRRGTT
jgi:two-component system cell cycle response regulator